MTADFQPCDPARGVAKAPKPLQNRLHNRVDVVVIELLMPADGGLRQDELDEDLSRICLHAGRVLHPPVPGCRVLRFDQRLQNSLRPAPQSKQQSAPNLQSTTRKNQEQARTATYNSENLSCHPAISQRKRPKVCTKPYPFSLELETSPVARLLPSPRCRTWLRSSGAEVIEALARHTGQSGSMVAGALTGRFAFCTSPIPQAANDIGN